MAGTVAFSYSGYDTRKRIQRITMAWTCTAGGAVSANASAPINGVITRITTVPDGTDVPTALYDVVLNDEFGLDLAAGLLANRSATLAEHVAPMLGGSSNVPVAVNGTLTPVISNAGNAKKGIIYVYVDTR